MSENSLKVVNIKSEILCRSAEDDFYYFYKVNSAYKKLTEAVALTPQHFKSILFLADVTFIKGNIKKALELYLRAEKINDLNLKVLASIANCYYILENYVQALIYCDKVISLFNTQNYGLFLQVYTIKINILIKEKQYDEAYKIWKTLQSTIDISSLKSFDNMNYEKLNRKINLQKKLQKTDLKIV